MQQYNFGSGGSGVTAGDAHQLNGQLRLGALALVDGRDGRLQRRVLGAAGRAHVIRDEFLHFRIVRLGGGPVTVVRVGGAVIAVVAASAGARAAGVLLQDGFGAAVRLRRHVGAVDRVG